MMKHFLFIMILSFMFIFSFSFDVYTEKQVESDEAIILNKLFYSNILKTSPIKRNLLIDALQNKIIQGKGYVELVESKERYHRRFRIIIIDSEAVNLNIRLYIFTNNEEYLKLLTKGDLFEFKGQFVTYTQLGTRRDSYIFDIILEDGALVVK